MALAALVGCWVVWIALAWEGFSLPATVAVGATVGNALLNQRSNGVPAWHAALVQKALEDGAVRLPIDVHEAIRYQLVTLGVPAQKVERVARGVALVAFRQGVIGRQIDMRGKVAGNPNSRSSWPDSRSSSSTNSTASPSPRSAA